MISPGCAKRLVGTGGSLECIVALDGHRRDLGDTGLPDAVDECIGSLREITPELSGALS